MAYLEELLPDFRKGAKIRRKDWDKGKYIVCIGAFVDNDLGKVHSLTNSDITGDVWEFYKEPEPDWDYVIQNKCLCWFWNADNDNKDYGLLGKIHNNLDEGDYRFYKKFEQNFKYCRPVRRDEVTFYVEKEDDC